jgi:hypothetical protein
MSLDFTKLADAFNTAKEAVARGEAAIAELASSHEAQIQELVVTQRGLTEELERLLGKTTDATPPETAPSTAEAPVEPPAEATPPVAVGEPETAAETAESEPELDPTGSHPVVQAAAAAAGGGDVTVSPGVAEATVAADPAGQPSDGNAEPAGSEEPTS